MNLRSSHLANCGARLAGVDFSRGSQAASPKTLDRAAPGVSALQSTSGDRFELTLTPHVQATLLLAARAAGVAPAEFIARAIVAHALEAVGFPDLSDEFTAVPEFSRIGETRFRNGGP